MAEKLTPRQAWEKAAAEAGLSRELIDAVSSITDHEVFNRVFTSRSDASRALDEQAGKVKLAEEELERVRKEFGTHSAQHQQWKQWYEGAKKKYEEMESKLAAAQSGSTPTPVDDPNKRPLTFADMQAILTEYSNHSMALWEDMGDAQAQHLRTFGTPLDVRKFVKFASERADSATSQRRPAPSLMDSYAEFVREPTEELTKKQREEELDKVRREAIEDYRSKHDLPIDSEPKGSPLFHRGEDKQPTGRDEFLAGWREGVESPG